MTFVSQLEPVELWSHFDHILTVPRGSKNEAQMATYVIEVAHQNGLSHRQDSAGNVVVHKSAGPGFEKAPTVVLQCHLDMVNEKNADVEHDFEKDPLRPRRQNGYLKATGTTLGSDNGIGIATCLALMEGQELRHGPLELLFTVDEETGLTGAAELEADFLQGRRLINLDAEEEGTLYVGCAGGAGIDLSLDLEWQPVPPGLSGLKFKIIGLKGGHSGVDIHLQRANAIKVLVRALAAIRPDSFLLSELQGGNMHNAIPREAFCSLAVESSRRDQVAADLTRRLEAVALEFRPADPGLQWLLEQAAGPAQVLTANSTAQVVGLLNALPHGVISMSYEIPELVETSSNLALAAIRAGGLEIHISNRSSVTSALDALQGRIASIAQLAEAQFHLGEGYPGWHPNLESEVLAVARRVYRQEFGAEPEIKAIHAGLECGIIGERFPGMDMVSLGPQIEFPHSPDERVQIDSVARYCRFLLRVLEELGKAA